MGDFQVDGLKSWRLESLERGIFWAFAYIVLHKWLPDGF